MLNPAKITLDFRQHSHQHTKFGFLQTQKTVLSRFLVKFCFSCLVTFLREMSMIFFATFTKLTSSIKPRHNSNMNSDPTNESKLLLNIQSCTPVTKETKYQLLIRIQYPFSKVVTIMSPKGMFSATYIVVIT